MSYTFPNSNTKGWQREVAAAREIAEKATREGRDFTPVERLAAQKHIDRAKALKGDDETLAELNRLGAPIDGVTATSGGRKSYRGPRQGTWGKSMRTFLERTGQKALTTSGTISVPALSSEIVVNRDRPRSILNLIEFNPLDGTDKFAYIRETVRTHNATTVAVGKKKPESAYELTKIEDTVSTIAHLVTVDRTIVADAELLQQYLEEALREGVELELEDQVLNGDGSTAGVLDNLTGILATSGTQAQAFDTDRVVTARKAVTKLEDVANGRLDPSGFAWVMSPGDWEAYELLQDTDHFVMGSGSGQGAAYGAVPVDRAQRRLWGYPVVTSLAMTTGAPLLGDFSPQSIEIREREGVTIEFATTGFAKDVYGEGLDGDLFEANKVRFRAEGRWGLAVKRPAAFIEVDVTP